MRDTIKGKAARWSLANEPDCGKCENCLEVQRLQQEYARIRTEPDIVIRKAGNGAWVKACHIARHAWLEASRLKRCTASRGPKEE